MALKDKTILIVDDTPANISIISGALKDHFKTKIATNGEKALVLASGQEKPDLILSDIVMPGMDGYELCRRLKADRSTRDIPIIFLTSKTDIEDEKKGFRTRCSRLHPQAFFSACRFGSCDDARHASGRTAGGAGSP